jgi:lipopolysaccharide transport system permease protein
MNKETGEDWDLIIKPKNKWYDLDISSIWKYKDLLFLLVRRDFVSVYKQTLLGPIWFFVQPIVTTITFTIIFGNMANISTDGIPPFLFYLSGLVLWTYFADCLNKTSNTFIANAGVFGKVYFPRLVVPLSILISNLVKLGVQIVLFLIVWVYYLQNNSTLIPNWKFMWLFPILVLIMAFLGFGCGILISSLTTKYRDLTFLVGFGIQLMMYASPIVYPISIVQKGTHPEYAKYLLLNPVSSIIEAFKYIFLGHGYFSPLGLIYSGVFTLLIVILSVIIFSRVEKSFMDTV